MIRVWIVLGACALALAEPVAHPHGAHHEGEKDHKILYRLVDPSKGQQPHAHDPHIQKENEIINYVLGPVYYQPRIIIDYRYLKTHRGYVEGPGGQDLILPKTYKDPHHSFDHLLEELHHEEVMHKKEHKEEERKEERKEERREERKEERREERREERKGEDRESGLYNKKHRGYWPALQERKNEWKY